VDPQKVMKDWEIAVQDTIFILQGWSDHLERWQSYGRAEPDDFADACQLLRETGLWSWARQAGGHGLAALARAIEVEEVWQNNYLSERTRS
jgi:hypothetical protein